MNAHQDDPWVTKGKERYIMFRAIYVGKQEASG